MGKKKVLNFERIYVNRPNIIKFSNTDIKWIFDDISQGKGFNMLFVNPLGIAFINDKKLFWIGLKSIMLPAL